MDAPTTYGTCDHCGVQSPDLCRDCRRCPECRCECVRRDQWGRREDVCLEEYWQEHGGESGGA